MCPVTHLSLLWSLLSLIIKAYICWYACSTCDCHLRYELTFLKLDYCPGGEIFSYLRRARRFNENTSRFYAAEITMTIEFLHDNEGVVYRDLKPENILLDADGHIKLVDFGFAKQIGDRETYTLCGTPEYLAPEVIHNSGHGLAVDWWALGILIYEFLVGQPPFWDQNPMRIYEQIVQGHIRFPVPSQHQHHHHHHSSRPPLHVPRAARDFILALCKTDPTERLGHIAGGSKRVMQHHFFDGINWDDIYYRRGRGPIIPRVEWAGDAGNFDEYPDPPEDIEESEAGRGKYTAEMRRDWDAAFDDF